MKWHSTHITFALFLASNSQYNKKFVLHLFVVPQLSSGRQHNYSTETRQAGHANEQSMYSLMSIKNTYSSFDSNRTLIVWVEIWKNKNKNSTFSKFRSRNRLLKYF
jgi:hypothetical protein